MDKSEIALKLTLCAIEHNVILYRYNSSSTDNAIEEDNAYDANPIAAFYNNILNNINL